MAGKVRSFARLVAIKKDKELRDKMPDPKFLIGQRVITEYSRYIGWIEDIYPRTSAFDPIVYTVYDAYNGRYKIHEAQIQSEAPPSPNTDKKVMERVDQILEANWVHDPTYNLYYQANINQPNRDLLLRYHLRAESFLDMGVWRVEHTQRFQNENGIMYTTGLARRRGGLRTLHAHYENRRWVVS